MSRVGRAIAVAIAIASVGSACACAGPGANDASTAKTTSLRMTGSPPEATVTIDDQVIGRLDVVIARGVALPEGVHRISVEAPGFFPWDEEVDTRKAGSGAKRAPIRVEARLEKVPE